LRNQILSLARLPVSPPERFITLHAARRAGESGGLFDVTKMLRWQQRERFVYPARNLLCVSVWKRHTCAFPPDPIAKLKHPV
jgi:hypothetical protein